MNLALVVHDFDPSLGQGRYSFELASRLAPPHRLDVYANSFAVEPRPGWNFIRVPAWRRNALFTVLTFILGAERRLRGRAYDVIHAQGLTSWRADVITAHVCNAARTKQSPPASLRARLFPALVNPVEERFYRQPRPRHLIAISRRVAAEVAHYYGWRRPVTVIPHGVDAGQFRPPADDTERRHWRERFGLPAGAWIWLFVGEATKGVAESIAQLPHFPRACLFVVSRSNRTPFESQAAAAGVGNRLHFWGPERAIESVYRAADVFLYPSRYDTFGMVVAEAMASGLPVIVGRDIGAAELIEAGRSGLLVDPADPTELRTALERIRADPGFGTSLGSAARGVAERNSWDACAAATDRVFRSL